MGRQRGRVVLRRIEDRRRRRICFRKRRAGLIKKAEELAVLCEADVGLIVVNPFDRSFHCFAAPATHAVDDA
uniref:MADS-box transcription factor 53 n=1 Tax=Brachypodium distachyon TaxID=15368 RepID=I1IX33_BRADI|nr:MADS-box transcription factor 53 [Brachypodium distachyon]